MGSAFDSWSAVDAAYYIGAGTAWEGVWLAIAVAMCVLALIVGARHENSAYTKADE